MNNINDFDNDFDIMLRKKAKSEPIILPNGFEERNNNLIKSLILNNNKPRYFKKYYLKLVVATMILVFTMGSIVVVAAQYISGGEFFANFFNNIANNDINNSYKYMNTEQLNSLATSTIGTVIDTDEITVDVLGVIKSGNTASIMLKVTANQLDSVLYDNGIETLKNFRFNDNAIGSLPECTEQISYRFYYSDEDKSLESNQFKILYTFMGINNFDKKSYSLGFDKFGYFTKGNGNLTDFVSIYDNKWNFDISFDTESNSYKTILVNKSITINNFNITVDVININPLACTISFRPEEYSDLMYKKISGCVSDFKIILDDGKILDSSQFDYSSIGKSKEKELEAILKFIVPISVDDIDSIVLFDSKFNIN